VARSERFTAPALDGVTLHAIHHGDPSQPKLVLLHGGGAMSQEFPLAYMYARMRALRFADGPDEVHRQQIARLELRRQTNWTPRAKDSD